MTRLAYLVSNVRLLRPDGSTAALAGFGGAAYLNPAENRVSLAAGTAPAGRYAGVQFTVGLDAAANHADPSRIPAGNALNPLVNGLHWGWQGGYVFCAIEGRYVRRADGRLGGYSYHLARDSNRMTVTLRHPFRLAPGGDGSDLRIAFEVARVFDAVHPVSIRPENGGDSTHSRPDDPLARRLADNVERAWAWEGVAASPSTVTAVKSRPPMTAPPASAASRKPYPFVVPAGFPQPTLPADNPLTVAGVALGRALFTEKRLSGNDTQSCASCHQAEHGYADGAHNFSVGIDGKPGTRRALPLYNLAWSNAFTWDGRRARVRDQVLAPIQDAREMHQSLARTVAKLKADSAYRARFAAAFGDPTITPERIGLAVEQYLLTLTACDSKFDRALRGEEKFTDEEKRGLELFVTENDPGRGQFGGDCFHCHGGNLFTDNAFHNDGLDETFDKDAGRGAITGRASDRGKFKTPSLRNVAVRGPYMHDGRFATLEAVIDHYSTGIRYSDTLDPNLAKHPDGGIRLGDADKKALVAFLKTLTDYRYLPAGEKNRPIAVP